VDKGTFFGCFLGAGLIVFAVILGGLDNLLLFLNIPAFLIVFGGSVASVMIAFPLKTVLKLPVFLRKSFIHEEQNPRQMIEQIITLAEIARRNGVLALEDHLEQIDEPFLADGVRMVVDSLSAENVEKILRAEINSMNLRHKRGYSLVAHYGKFTPAFGMIGTLIGLVLMFAHLNPDTIGSGMAVAILTTLYGAAAAYLLLLPIAGKLAVLNDSEIQLREMILKGILALQNGDHPRVIRMKLQTCLAPKERLQEDGFNQNRNTKIDGKDENEDDEEPTLTTFRKLQEPQEKTAA
jgi:chemotaxis protein MotA